MKILTYFPEAWNQSKPSLFLQRRLVSVVMLPFGISLVYCFHISNNAFSSASEHSVHSGRALLSYEEKVSPQGHYLDLLIQHLESLPGSALFSQHIVYSKKWFYITTKYTKFVYLLKLHVSQNQYSAGYSLGVTAAIMEVLFIMPRVFQVVSSFILVALDTSYSGLQFHIVYILSFSPFTNVILTHVISHFHPTPDACNAPRMT